MMLSLIHIYEQTLMLSPTCRSFITTPSLLRRSIHYFDFCDNNFFAFLYSFTTTVQIPKQYSSVCPTAEVYISGIIMHIIFISASFSHYYVQKHLPGCHELLSMRAPVPSSVDSNICIYECLFIHSTSDGHHLKHSYFIFILES